MLPVQRRGDRPTQPLLRDASEPVQLVPFFQEDSQRVLHGAPRAERGHLLPPFRLHASKGAKLLVDGQHQRPIVRALQVGRGVACPDRAHRGVSADQLAQVGDVVRVDERRLHAPSGAPEGGPRGEATVCAVRVRVHHPPRARVEGRVPKPQAERRQPRHGEEGHADAPLAESAAPQRVAAADSTARTAGRRGTRPAGGEGTANAAIRRVEAASCIGGSWGREREREWFGVSPCNFFMCPIKSTRRQPNVHHGLSYVFFECVSPDS